MVVPAFAFAAIVAERREIWPFPDPPTITPVLVFTLIPAPETAGSVKIVGVMVAGTQRPSSGIRIGWKHFRGIRLIDKFLFARRISLNHFRQIDLNTENLQDECSSWF
jgi:hypothetical protein